jgi:hypothetical protein
MGYELYPDYKTNEGTEGILIREMSWNKKYNKPKMVTEINRVFHKHHCGLLTVWNRWIQTNLNINMSQWSHSINIQSL